MHYVNVVFIVDSESTTHFQYRRLDRVNEMLNELNMPRNGVASYGALRHVSSGFQQFHF